MATNADSPSVTGFDPSLAHTLPAEEVVAGLRTDAEVGLSEAEAAARLAEHGPNALREVPRPGLGVMFLRQFNDFLIWLLLAAALVAAVVSYSTGESYADSIAILIIVVLIAVMGVVQEYRAENALLALKEMSAPEAAVIRSGAQHSVPAREVVPGDLIAIETGNYVPADVRLTSAVNLRIDEAPLTGESVAVRKDADVVFDQDTQRADRRNMAYGGTVATYGRGRGVCVATGMDTAIGQIADLIQSYEQEATPLQQRLDQLGKSLGAITLVISAVVFAVGLVRETDLALLLTNTSEYAELYGAHVLQLFMVAVSLAIAAVPEGLPAVVTISLAIGMQRMARRNALVRRLPAVETLGSATTICSDKTGTLTQNEMMVVQAELEGEALAVTGEGYAPTGEWTLDGAPFDPAGNGDLRALAAASTLASNAMVVFEDGRWRVVGDPTEGALVTFAARAGLDREELDSDFPRVGEIPFDSARKRMATIHTVEDTSQIELPGAGEGAVVALVKGAPDVVLALSDNHVARGRSLPLDDGVRARIEAANTEMASRALRVLAVAYRVLGEAPAAPDAEHVEQGLTLLGLVGMIDPPRPEAQAAIRTAADAGLRTIMITGDHRDTAVAIADELGLLRSDGEVITGAELNELTDEELVARAPAIDVYARVSPRHKVRIVEALKDLGQIVAMTGDGVNDAPALKRSHIGVAMGLTGTDVSRETADMVLTDDNYASIVAAIEEGRTIYNNIRKFVYYLLSCNIGEILIILIAMLLALAPEPPLLPIHLLWLNLVTDGLPALALGMEPAEQDVMDRPPRDPEQAVLSRDVWPMIAVQAVVEAIATLAVFTWYYQTYGDLVLAQTVAFATLTCAELLRAYTSRSETKSIFSIGVFSNRWMVLATASSFALLLIAIYVPALSNVFRTVPLGWSDWSLIAMFAVMPAAVAELSKWFIRRQSRSAA
ncbi:MAG: cation-translocating P-type ATPase [Anaerolineae bacterium]